MVISLTELEQALNLVIRALQRQDKDKLELETRVSMATRQCRHIFKATKKGDTAFKDKNNLFAERC